MNLERKSIICVRSETAFAHTAFTQGQLSQLRLAQL